MSGPAAPEQPARPVGPPTIADSLIRIVRQRVAVRPVPSCARRPAAGGVARVALVGLLLAVLVGVGATPVAAQAGTGQFEVRDGQIVDPSGAPFVAVGTNANGPNAFFDVPSRGLAATLVEGWRFNAVRLVTCLPGGCQGGNSTVNNDLDGLVAEFTARKMVVIVEYHQLDIGKTATDAELSTAATFWRDLARRFKDNPYVWFNLFNEPEGNFNDYNGAPGTAPQRWRRQHQVIIDAIRAEGAPNVIVIDDTQAGQGAADWWKATNSPDADSGIISEGANLVDPQRRLVFSVHAYDVWGFPNDGSTNCSNRYSDAQRDARFRSYVQRIRDRGLALIVGELGFRPTDELDRGLSDHGERFGQQPPCGSTQRLAAETVYRVAPEFDLGILTWHGYALVDEGPQNFTLAGGNPPSNLTRMGELQFAYARSVGTGTPGGDPPVAMPPATPTTAATSETTTSTGDGAPATSEPATPDPVDGDRGEGEVAADDAGDGDPVGTVALVVAAVAAVVALVGIGVLIGRRDKRDKADSAGPGPTGPGGPGGGSTHG